MPTNPDTENLEKLLDRIDDAASEHTQVTLESVMEHVGRRSFGPLLLVAGIIVLAPLIGDIPGVPTLMALVVALIAIQLLLRRDYFWLPEFLLNRSASQHKLQKSVSAMRKPARFIDKLLKPRLSYLTEGAAVQVIAVAALCIALSMPPMELIPFSANLAGAALTAYGLALIARDGVLVVIALLFSAGIVWLGVKTLLGQ